MAKFLIQFRKRADGLVKALSDKVTLIDGKLNELVLAVLTMFHEYAQEYSPVLSGALRDSIVITYYGLSGYIMATVDYAIYVILGTMPHEIRPVTAQALWWEGALHPVKLVNHPGTTPNDFFANAYMDGMFEAEDLIDKFGDWLKE